MLAGCAKSSDVQEIVEDRPDVAADKGAIAGLLIDDRYRPIPDALVVLTPGGLTTTTDSAGQFDFRDLEAGVYVIQVAAEGHEAAPKNVDVVLGQYTEAEVEARRIFSEGGGIITTQYSAFVACAINFVAQGFTINCLGDLSGDSFRSGFVTPKFNKTLNWTVMVSEALFNQQNTWNFQVREQGNGERYAVGVIDNGVYKKMVNYRGQVNEVDNMQRSNVRFNATKPFETLIFLQGDYQEESQSTLDQLCAAGVTPACRAVAGAGAAFGIKAKLVQSIFIGVPETPIATYCVLAPEGQCSA